MNRRSFFALAASAIAAAFLPKRAQAETHTLSVTELPSYNRDWPHHSHLVSDPGHQHSIRDFAPLDLGRMRGELGSDGLMHAVPDTSY
jgi:hypothetical protein